MSENIFSLSFFVLFFFACQSCFGQKYLQVEKINSFKLLKYDLGNTFVFRTADGGDDWYTRTLTDVDHDLNMLFLDHSVISLSDVTYVKSYNNRGWSKSIAQSMRIFALTWVGYTAADELFYDGADWEVAAFTAGSALALSVPIELLFKSKTHNVKSKFRLRIMDIGF